MRGSALLRDRIRRVRIESPQECQPRIRGRPAEHLHICDQRLALVLRHIHPAVPRLLLVPGMDPIIISVRDEAVISVVAGNLLRNLLPVLRRQRGDVELIAKRPRERHICPRIKRRHPPDLLVRALRDMRAHRGHRIDERSTLLDPEPLDRVGVVRAPDLRAVIHHSRVKPSAAARAVLQQQIREVRDQPLLHLIEAQYIAVHQLALSLRRQAHPADI